MSEQKTENNYLQFLLSNGITLDEIKKYRRDGISLEEVAGTVQRMIDRGEAPTTQEETASVKRHKKYLTEDALEEYLIKNEMSVRLNVITHDVEISGIDDEYNPETRRQDFPVILYDELKPDFICDRQIIVDLLSLIAGRYRYNPVLELIDGEEWDNRDYLGELIEILGIQKEDTLSQTLLYKWLVQCYQMLHNDIRDAYGADGMLVLQGPQGIGKTSFVRTIGIRPDFVKLGQYLDTHDKDTLRRCTSAWIVELGEIETTLKSDIERLKAFITAEKDEYRLPYGRADQTLARRTSLIGTCNSERFLIDPTGSRRFWTIPVENIDLNRLMSFNSLQLWRQIKVLCADHPNEFRLTPEEREELEARNAQHEKPLKAQLEVEDILSDAEENPNNYEWRYITVSDFKNEYRSLSSCTVNQIGQALDKLKIGSIQKRVNGKRPRVRRLPCIKRGFSYSPINTGKPNDFSKLLQ
ncbi:VapE domain-containing protein [uncultured Dysosmobacter sp.]|uniref:VapE domain-containing protein n=1 Tax=uncultured Dysosmobacter sp. TaxID=2591384 RepID=UPI0026193E10|nr:VapE domain-containing protein [uncultured Dysosmobacter sp.]